MVNIRASTCACGKAVPSFGVQGAPVIALDGALDAPCVRVYVCVTQSQRSTIVCHSLQYRCQVRFGSVFNLRSTCSLPYMQCVVGASKVANASLQGNLLSLNFWSRAAAYA